MYTALLLVGFLLLMLSFMLLWPFSSFIEARLGEWAYPVLATAFSSPFSGSLRGGGPGATRSGSGA